MKRSVRSKILIVLSLCLIGLLAILLVFNFMVYNSDTDDPYLPTTTTSETRSISIPAVKLNEERLNFYFEPIEFNTCNLNKDIFQKDIIDMYVDITCQQYEGMDPEFVKNIIWVESCYNPNAIGWKGQFLGLMQISPRWHSERANKLGLNDWFNPYDNIRVGIDILAEIQEYNNDPIFVAMAYSLGGSEAAEKYRAGEITWYAKEVVYNAGEKRTKQYAS